MAKVDFKQELKHLYNPSPKEATIVDVPDMNFLMVHGAGNPNTAQEYKGAVDVSGHPKPARDGQVKIGQLR